MTCFIQTRWDLRTVIFSSFDILRKVIKSAVFTTFAETGLKTGRVETADRGVFQRGIVLEAILRSVGEVLTN